MMEENQVLNKFARFICFASLVLTAVMTTNCGSSSSPPGKPTCTGGPYDVVGDWGLNTDGGTTSTTPYFPGVINSAGLGMFFEANITNADPNAGSELIIPSITGACSFSENLKYYVTRAVVGGGGVYSYPVQGKVQSGPAISGTINEGTSSTTFVGLPNPLSPPTALTSSLSVVDTSSPVGCPCVQVQVLPSGTGNSADMILSGTDGVNCNLSGTFTQEGSNAANLNVFDVSLTFTGTTCQVTGTITGLGFESPADYFNFVPFPPSGIFLYAMSGNSADVFEFFP